MKADKSKFSYCVSAAGRINIIGEHIDYCGGKVLPAALGYKNTVYIRKNGTDKINIAWTTSDKKVTLDIDRLNDYRDIGLGSYQAGCAQVLKNSGRQIMGCDILSDCTVPFGSGLSSSAAIEVSTIAALCEIAGEHIAPVDAALLAQMAEREYVGMNCGIMDQYASACGKKNMAMLLDCRTLECKYIPVELGSYALVVADTKKPHSLVTSAYNERREQTEIALGILKKKLDVEYLSEVKESDLERYSFLMDEVIYRRAKHVVCECGRVNDAVAAMAAGDMGLLGMLLDASHDSLKNLYEVTGAEPDALVAAAQSHPACMGSRMTGGGFGGCTVSVVLKEAAEDFKEYVGTRYKAEIGYAPEFYDADICDGLTVKKL